MRTILLSFLLFFVIRVSPAQESCELTISGKILSETGEALAGATIYIPEVKRGTITNERGAFTINGLCRIKIHLEIKYLGFADKVEIIRPENFSDLILVLSPTKELLEEVIVEERFQSVKETQNFSALSGNTLEETRGKSLGESLKELPGVNSIQTGPSIFKPVIHGVHSLRILVLNNGIRHEGQQWGAEHAPEIDPFIASNVVVIKDATAIKYGTDALGGVVVVNPPDLPTSAGIGGSLNLVGQSNGISGAVSGMLEGGIKNLNGFGWRAQATGRKSGDFHAPNYILSNTGFEELNFSLATGYHLEKYGIEVFYSHFKSELGILRGAATSSLEDLLNAFEQEPPQYTEPFTYSIQPPRQEVSHDLFKLTAHRHADVGEWRFQYGLQVNKRKEFDIRRGALKDVPSIDLDLFSHTIDFELEHTLRENIAGSVGVNGMFQVNNNVPGTQRIPFIPDYNNRSAGVYVAEKFTLRNWLLDIGMRYDLRNYDVTGFDFKNALYTSTLKFHNFSATAGISKAIRKHGKFTTTIGSTWRPPHVAELYSLGTHQSAGAIEYGLLLDESTNEVLDISAINFKNEQALKWVSSYTYHGSKWHAELTGYLNYIFHYIYLQPRGITENVRGVYPYFRYTQTNASFLGMDFSTHFQWTRNLLVRANASVLRAADETNDDFLLYIPANRFEIAFRYESKPERLNWYGEIKGKFVSRQHSAPRVVTIREITDAYESGADPFENDSSNFDFLPAPNGYFLCTVAAGIAFPIHTSKLDFRVSCDNLFNTSYREYTNRMRYYADDIGRNITLALKLSF